MDSAIRAAVRIRPLSTSELRSGSTACVRSVASEQKVIIKNTDKCFTYDCVLDHHTSQNCLYDTVARQYVEHLFKGHNASILAYGQTGSGKTEGEMGIIPRALCDVFQKIKEAKDHEFSITASFVELYQEQLFDLLACSSKPRDQCVVDIREDSRGGVRTPGLTEMEVVSTEDALKALMMGSAVRATGATAMNAQSSRSHAIFTLTVKMCGVGGDKRTAVSKLRFVDLAGSEKPQKIGSSEDSFREGVKINSSLLALGNVISGLNGKHGCFVAHRDSKLTQSLCSELSGKSAALLLACVSPANGNIDESVNTLQFADRTRHAVF